MKKYVAEFIGTFVLTLFGCGSAALSGGVDGVLGVLGISMAFGLSIVAMAYSIGNIFGSMCDPVITGLGTNGYGSASYVGLSMGGAIAVEIILTFVFLLAILGVTSTEKFSSAAGLVIGLTLAFVHIIGIPLTGTSVNPARSLGPALLACGHRMDVLKF